MRKSIPMSDLNGLRRGLWASPQTHRNEFPVGYSLAGCSPAEPVSASPTSISVQPWDHVRRAIFTGRYVSNKLRVSKGTAVHLYFQTQSFVKSILHTFCSRRFESHRDPCPTRTESPPGP